VTSLLDSELYNEDLKFNNARVLLMKKLFAQNRDNQSIGKLLIRFLSRGIGVIDAQKVIF
jgi:hypothetical protein